MPRTRRQLLQAAAGSAALLAAPAWATAPRRRPRLPIPEVLTCADLRIPIVEAEVPILPGAPTRMWTYGGTFPGPTIRRPTGTPTRVRFEHRLPRAAGELSVHLHGGHTPARHDGQPGGLTDLQPRSLFCAVSSNASNTLLLEPGEARTYEYPFTEAGAPSRAATHWYHDHRLDRTARNVWRGLAGMFVTDDDVDAALPLPRGDRDLPLVIADRAFDRHNQLRDPAGNGVPDDGATGRRVLVNGALLPQHRVRAARYRLRILNASNFRAYSLQLTGGATLTQIGTESGLLPKPLPRATILLGPGERVDVIADFTNAAHSDVRLRSVRRPGARELGSTTLRGELMTFAVGARATDATRVPPELRPLPAWTADLPDHVSHEWRISVSSGFRPTWLLNGRTFDPGRADHRPRLGTVETWRLTNDTDVAHLLHLHHTDWIMRSRNGRPPAPHEAGLKETFFLDPGDRLEVSGRFTDFAGKYVVHCHMLDHEDHGLMGQFETVA